MQFDIIFCLITYWFLAWFHEIVRIPACDWRKQAINIFYPCCLSQSAHKSTIKTDSSAAWLSVYIWSLDDALPLVTSLFFICAFWRKCYWTWFSVGWNMERFGCSDLRLAVFWKVSLKIATRNRDNGLKYCFRFHSNLSEIHGTKKSIG